MIHRLTADHAPITRWLLAALALASLTLSVSLAVSLGELNIPLAVTFKALLNGAGLAHYEVPRIQQGIIWDYRLSRALVAACCGAGLSLCGAVLQALLRNVLAEPYVLGISAGASTGAVLVMLLGLGGGVVGISLGAFIGAALAFTLVLLLATGIQGGPAQVILAGVAGAQLFNALTAWVVSTSANAEQARSVMFWLLGSLSGVRWADVGLAATVVAAGLAVCLYCARTLDAFVFGDDAAASLGVAVAPVRLVLFGITALITACLVSIVGAVGFVGLVVPHMARLLVGPRHVRLLLACVLIGANFMVLADIASRLIVPGQVLPIGVVTALVGAPVFAALLYRNRRPA
ncbi:FecCD family ABC transporter permease [Pseudomonas eucalypticola]|uniref:Iron ABC transporter permease n=1 Tax=Pseudomonas eucalypticola TaxID=2599595 RepID=A0A7D5H5B6_9PSED|nr:iron ABC transporter permease [Pseudomonas eucalypticola]QKZ05982.1 iron ABC transporter permease [Pseudomonas eucalypticola]